MKLVAQMLLPVLALAVLVVSAPAARGEDDDIFGGHTSAGEDAFEVDGEQGSDDTANPASNPGSGSDSGLPVEYIRAPLCASNTNRSDLAPSCPYNDPIVETCLDGSEALNPLWRREQNADGTWSEWTVVEMYSCPGDAALIEAIEHEWTTLTPQPSDIDLQPDTGWVLATVPTIAMAGDAPRLHAATLLGEAVEIRATASGYVWDWGDGTQTTTTDPGRPYPNATLTHTFPRASDGSTVSLTTTWTGEFRVNGGPWHAIAGTITSESPPVELAIYDPRSRLVNCDLYGNCVLASR